MRVVLDSNVLLAALISPHGAPDLIYRAWRSRRFELLTSTEQIDELRRASRYPKLKAILPAHRVGTMVNNLQRAIILEPMPSLNPDIDLHDPGDAFLLSIVLAGHADYLITGDRRAGLLRLGHIRRTRILTPADFCNLAL